MAKILVVDDDPAGREFLTTLLGYGGHDLLGGADGVEGLALARAERPHLVIADVLMPTMDGYEFVRQLRGDPAIANTPVIFYTASYHEREAHALAAACSVTQVLTKPAEPEVILETVNRALGSSPPPVSAPAEEFDREHLRLLTDKLAASENELQAANLRLTALLEVSWQLTSQRDAEHLLRDFCSSAREIVGASFAFVGILKEESRELGRFLTAGMDPETAGQIGWPSLDRGLLAQLLDGRHALRAGDASADPLAAGFPPRYRSARSFLGAPVSSPSGLYGLVYLVGKLGGGEFSGEDERVITTLAQQAAVAYENVCRYEEIRKFNEALERRVLERTAQLSEANKELEAFAYSVSHDLRAPLRHIAGFSKILLEDFGQQLEPTAQHNLRRIHEAVQRMGQLVDDLLTLARVGRRELSVQITSLDALVRDVLAELKPDLEGRQVDWRIGRLPFVACDPGLMKQVFANLLANALKFTRPREVAVIEVDQLAGEGPPVIFVRDNGVGFNMKYADKLFGVFQRLHRPEDFEGTGVGLATVLRIVHKHRGRVWAEAELDKGATFYLALGPDGGVQARTDDAARGEAWQPVR